MKTINGVTYGYMSHRGEWNSPAGIASLNALKTRTNANTVILAVAAEQANAWATTINWQATTMLTDAEIIATAQRAHALGMQVILKPMVNLIDGNWRAHINFFDHAEPCEPSWGEWFTAYQSFISHYAVLAERMKAEMLVIGCELVNSDRRATEWRALIRAVRRQYHGLITYNCDKYQEGAVSWWDAVDVISSSGYYPATAWPAELARIQQIVLKANKPFFFCEAGCPSRLGAELLPNDWASNGTLSMQAQLDWYDAMFTAVVRHPWVRGFGLWDWKATLYQLSEASQNNDYALYGKPAEALVKEKYKF